MCLTTVQILAEFPTEFPKLGRSSRRGQMRIIITNLFLLTTALSVDVKTYKTKEKTFKVDALDNSDQRVHLYVVFEREAGELQHFHFSHASTLLLENQCCSNSHSIMTNTKLALRAPTQVLSDVPKRIGYISVRFLRSRIVRR